MLIDTNIIIEIAFNQKRAEECKKLLNAIDQRAFEKEVYVTRFALSAIEAMSSKQPPNFLREFLLLILEDKIKIFDLKVEDDLMVNSVHSDLGLDFDDAVQYVAANRLGTWLITLDKDFKSKGLIVKTPAEVLKEILA
ncbi:MAG: PIN domain-containing protein [Candidatus Peregrinibacteria bacterium]|nr:PIN domain-containing protein [Candidatus Peregrinibacteria bacterium]